MVGLSFFLFGRNRPSVKDVEKNQRPHGVARAAGLTDLPRRFTQLIDAVAALGWCADEEEAHEDAIFGIARPLDNPRTTRSENLSTRRWRHWQLLGRSLYVEHIALRCILTWLMELYQKCLSRQKWSQNENYV
jgi:hypothetical protein